MTVERMEGRLAAGAALAEAGAARARTGAAGSLPATATDARATRAPELPGADGVPPRLDGICLPNLAGGVPRGQPGPLFPRSPEAGEAARGSTAGRSSTFRDLSGAVRGHLEVLRYVRTDGHLNAVWACRCRCGREDCPVDVERTTARLRKRRLTADCREFRLNDRSGSPAPRGPPEDVRPPWSRSADERADRDAKLLGVFSRADLR